MKRKTILSHFSGMKRAFALVMLGMAFPTAAQTTVYTDQGLFRTAAGGTPDVLEDFNTTAPGPLSNLTGGPFTLSQTGDGDAAIVLDPGSPDDVDGTVFLNTALDRGTMIDTITFSFVTPVSAVGFELNPFIIDAGNAVDFTTDLPAESGTYLLPSDLGGFRGLVFTNPINSLTLTADPDDFNAFHGIDNVEMFVVPEPTSLALLGLGGLIAIRRRR